MSYSHLLLALSVVFVWGTNFVVIRWGLDGLPSFLFATLRFAFSALPWLLFIRRPAVAWSKLAAFGVLLGVGQFALLFLAMRADISPGLASLVIQLQVFFTIGLSLLTLGERVRGFQLVGLVLAVCGLGVIAAHIDASLTLKGLALVLSAAFFWSSVGGSTSRAACPAATIFSSWKFPSLNRLRRAALRSIGASASNRAGGNMKRT